MDLESQLQLSYYREIALLNENHRVWLVQHTETQKIYVKKPWRFTICKCIAIFSRTPSQASPAFSS